MMRNGLVDYCRLIAALGIVWFHTEAPGERIAYAAVPFFIVLLSLPSRSGLAERARRLLVPFVVWSGIYAALRVSNALHAGSDPFDWWRPWMVLTGTSIHLWFLPFAFLVALAAPLLRASRAVLALPVLAAAGLALVEEPLAYPWYQWSFGLIPALVGFAYVQTGRLALLSLIVSFAVLTVFRPAPDNITILAGSGLAILVLSVRMPTSRLSDWCARHSMWIYLSHILVINRAQSFGLEGYALAICAVVASVAIAMLIDVLVQRLGRSRILDSPRP